jgi:hypothetical protein
MIEAIDAITRRMRPTFRRLRERNLSRSFPFSPTHGRPAHPAQCFVPENHSLITYFVEVQRPHWNSIAYVASPFSLPRLVRHDASGVRASPDLAALLIRLLPRGPPGTLR